MFGRKKAEPLRDDIAAAAEAAKISRVALGRTLRKLEDKLINGERVTAMAAGYRGRQVGVLVHTTHRILFTVDSVGGVTTDAVALERVTDVAWERKGAAMTSAGTLTVSTPNRSMVFTLVPESFALGLQAAAV